MTTGQLAAFLLGTLCGFAFAVLIYEVAALVKWYQAERFRRNLAKYRRNKVQ